MTQPKCKTAPLALQKGSGKWHLARDLTQDTSRGPRRSWRGAAETVGERGLCRSLQEGHPSGCDVHSPQLCSPCSFAGEPGPATPGGQETLGAFPPSVRAQGRDPRHRDESLCPKPPSGDLQAELALVSWFRRFQCLVSGIRTALLPIVSMAGAELKHQSRCGRESAVAPVYGGTCDSVWAQT